MRTIATRSDVLSFAVFVNAKILLLRFEKLWEKARPIQQNRVKMGISNLYCKYPQKEGFFHATFTQSIFANQHDPEWLYNNHSACAGRKAVGL